MPKKNSNTEVLARGRRQIACPQCKEICLASSNLCRTCSHVFSAYEKRQLVAGKSFRNTRGKFVEEAVFTREMAERGFHYVKLINGHTGEVIQNESDPKIEALGLEFGVIPSSADAIYVIQTSPQVQIAMSLDKFLELTGIKPDN